MENANELFQAKVTKLLNKKYKGNITSSFKKDFFLLKKGYPLEYLLNEIDFLNFKINLSKKPFIPRVETEFWVKKAIFILEKEQKENFYFLDLFSGSGCIGIALLKKFKNSKVDFAEIVNDFCQQIRINLKINKINPTRFSIIKSNVFSAINKKYDAIFANPPYIPIEKKKTLNYLEPEITLFAKEKGLFYIKKILKESKNYLKKNGKLFFEFSPEQLPQIKTILKSELFKKFQIIFDQFNLPRAIYLAF